MTAWPLQAIWRIALLCYLFRLRNIYFRAKGKSAWAEQTFICWLVEPIEGNLSVIQVRIIFGMKK